MKTIPLLGIALATVIPHPAYKPLQPCVRYIVRAVGQKEGATNRVLGPAFAGRNSSRV